MAFFNVPEKIREILPFDASAFVVEEIALQSSFIPFYGAGEVLFKKGDQALGFYWILSGEAEILIPEKRPIILSAGAMAGLDSFIEEGVIPFDVVNRGQHLSCLFIDRRCYNNMREHQDFNRYMNSMVMNCLRSYRNLLVPAQARYL